MAYVLKIKREDPIDYDELLVVTNQLEGIRIIQENATVQQGPGGVMLRTPVAPGSIEILIQDKWTPAFNYREDEGCLSFRAPYAVDIEDANWKAATTLAKILDATIIGEESERYDLDTLECTKYQDGDLHYANYED